MGKKQRVKSSAKDELLDAKDQPLAADNRSIDPTLDALFTSSVSLICSFITESLSKQ